MTDPQAAEALALVQTHRAVGYPTILQAFNERARIQEARKLGLRLGEWQVLKQEGQRYEVRIYMREQGTNAVVRTGFHLARGPRHEARECCFVTCRWPDAGTAGRRTSARSQRRCPAVTAYNVNGVFTCTFAPCTRTSTQATRISGFSGRSPVRTLKRHPCHGHSSTSPSSVAFTQRPARHAGRCCRRREIVPFTLQRAR